MGFKKTFFVAAIAFAAGVHYSPKFYEEVEKREEDRKYIDETDAEFDKRSPWSMGYNISDAVRSMFPHALFQPVKDVDERSSVPITQAESAQIYLNAFDKGYKAASEDKQNVAKQYKKFFGDVTAEEVQSEMRGG